MHDPEFVNDGTEPATQSAEGTGPAVSSRLALARALMGAALGARIPTGPLGPDTVTQEVLALPVRLLTEELVRHAKTCRNRRCPLIPTPLLPYHRGWRPDAIRNVRDHVHKVLWTHADHRMVAKVRSAILSKHSDLAKEISSGSLLEGDRIGVVLDELGEHGPQIIAAVVWATDFDGPEAELLFRLLAALTRDGASQSSQTAVIKDLPRLKTLSAELRKATTARKHADRAAEQATHDLGVNQRALARSKSELTDTRRKHDETAAKLSDLQGRMRDLDAVYQTLERDAEKAARANADLRRDFQRVQRLLRDLEVERSDLALKLASERRLAERLSRRLEDQPKAPTAFWDFLRAEERRIEEDKSVRQGGDRIRAEQEWTVHRKLTKAFLEVYPEYRVPAPVRIRQKSSLRFVPLGGSDEVGRSCYLVELGQYRIVVDCGIKPSGPNELRPNIDSLDHIDALVLTHAHTDHIGWLPALVRKLGEFDIYCSEGTAALLPVMLEDCHNHYRRRLAKQQDNATYSRNKRAVDEDYDEDDVHAIPRLAITCEFDREELLPFGGATIRFFRAGHILGAASVLIEDNSGRRIFFSGDFSSFPQLTVSAATWPNNLGEVDLFVLESTYGGRGSHPPREKSHQELVEFLRETTERRNGSVILASFGLGRAQELLKLIATSQQQGDLAAGIPVHVDGMIRRINPIYRRFAEFAVPPEVFNEVSGETERLEVAVNAQTRPSIIVTTSGMLNGGPVIEYARQLLPDPRHRIVLTGYQDEGAPSKPLLDLTRPAGTSRVITVEAEDGELIHFDAAMPAKEVRLSSHADQPGLLEYSRRLSPSHIALVHGDRDAQAALGPRLSEIHPRAEITSGPAEVVLP